MNIPINGVCIFLSTPRAPELFNPDYWHSCYAGSLSAYNIDLCRESESELVFRSERRRVIIVKEDSARRFLIEVSENQRIQTLILIVSNKKTFPKELGEALDSHYIPCYSVPSIKVRNKAASVLNSYSSFLDSNYGDSSNDENPDPLNQIIYDLSMGVASCIVFEFLKQVGGFM